MIHDPRFQAHDPGYMHPESPRRLEWIESYLASPDIAPLYVTWRARAASKAELAWNHDPSYVDLVEAACKTGPRRLDPDTAVSPGSWEAACVAAGAVFSGIDALEGGQLRSVLALVRPPGHHAEADRARGFCLFNNVALGAQYARGVLGFQRILIADWDLHHGNGTQHSFYDDPNVLYISTHQFPYYPGSGAMGEVGVGKGEGFNVNIPLPAHSDDETYTEAFYRIVAPVGKAFEPDLVLVSIGFDIHHDDPLGYMDVTQEGIAAINRVLLDLAAECCGGRILFCLEGGYSPRGLEEGMTAMLQECAAVPQRLSDHPARGDHPVIEPIAEFHSRYWSVLSAR